jgi:cyanate permease
VDRLQHYTQIQTNTFSLLWGYAQLLEWVVAALLQVVAWLPRSWQGTASWHITMQHPGVNLWSASLPWC